MYCFVALFELPNNIVKQVYYPSFDKEKVQRDQFPSLSDTVKNLPATERNSGERDFSGGTPPATCVG